ncbi:hypothetical protein HaLaN_21328 [Haematococcus lacustris]|uniref:Uncharacterized protein n=1 Tax=Haematococcus lacustris TaxID=44745 RepID=A0A699ZY52_HAELA|nr:hypothetical protein HaLaN_21328 [Haematococcus lacustris]
MAKKKRRTVPRLVPEDPDSDIEDRDEALQPDLTEAERKRKVSGEARAARDRDNTYHGRKWLRPVYSEAKRSQVRGLMCSTSNNIRFYDRDVSAALNIRRGAVGPGPRPTELPCCVSGGASGGDSQLQQYDPRKQDTKPLTKGMCVSKSYRVG